MFFFNFWKFLEVSRFVFNTLKFPSFVVVLQPEMFADVYINALGNYIDICSSIQHLNRPLIGTLLTAKFSLVRNDILAESGKHRMDFCRQIIHNLSDLLCRIRKITPFETGKIMSFAHQHLTSTHHQHTRKSFTSNAEFSPTGRLISFILCWSGKRFWSKSEDEVRFFIASPVFLSIGVAPIYSFVWCSVTAVQLLGESSTNNLHRCRKILKTGSRYAEFGHCWTVTTEEF